MRSVLKMTAVLVSIMLLSSIGMTTVAAASISSDNMKMLKAIQSIDSSEGYAQKKEEFGRKLMSGKDVDDITIQPKALFSNASVNNNIMSNEYIEFAVDLSNGRFSVGTVGGNPSLDSDNHQKMLYGHPSPWSSYTTVKINDDTFIYGDKGFKTNPYFEGNSNYSEGSFGDVDVKQVVSLVKNSSTNREDVVEIKYIATNKGKNNVSFGLRIMLDTMLGSNDHAPFRLPGIGDLTTEKELSGDSIPQYWQAFDSLDNPRVVSYGSFVSGGINPKKVQFTNWSNVFGQPWGYNVSEGSANGDSAVSIIWERTLSPGSQEIYETRYGLSELLQDLQPPLGLTIASGASITKNPTGDGYLPYTITAYIQNIGSAKAENVVCSIQLPDELAFSNGSETGIVNVGSLNVGQVVTVEKVITVKQPSSKTRNSKYDVIVSASNTATKKLTKEITIDAIAEGKKAIIVVPGICGSRLYSGIAVNTKDYLSDIVDQFQSGKKEYFNFEKGHMLWEPYSSYLHGEGLEKLALITKYQNEAQSEMLMCRCDEEGKTMIPISIMDPITNTYGAQDTYKNLVDDIQHVFGHDYDVRFFSYDWRNPNQKSAEALEKFINDQNYSNVILVCHSMGGIVASEYLSRSSNNKNKVNKLITLGTPYLGAPKALYVMETGNFMDWASNAFCMATPLKILCPNLNGIYQLIPSEMYFSLNNTTYVKKYNNNGFWGKHSEERLNYQNTQNLIKNRSWAKNSSGKVKPMLATATALYEDIVTKQAHIIGSVDSYVVIGYNKDTIMEVVEEYNKDESFKQCRGVTVLNGGDGTVPVISANIGGLNPKDKTYYIVEEHSKLAQNDDVIDLVISIINGSPNPNKSTIKKSIEADINSKGWWIIGQPERIRIKLECPVSLSLVDNGNVWAYTDGNIVYNENKDRASLYVMGENNGTKVAYLSSKKNDVILKGMDDGLMDYTVSLLQEGFETKRVVFQDIPVTEKTRIYTNTDIEDGIVLKVDEDDDGSIDKVIKPDIELTGTDLEEEDSNIQIIEQPIDQYVVVGQRATFRVVAEGDGLRYQWYINRNGGKGWIAIDGAVGAEYTTSQVDLSNDGYQYYCLITDRNGNTVQSAIAVLHVRTTPDLPETGDNSKPLIWLIMIILSLIVLFQQWRRRQEN